MSEGTVKVEIPCSELEKDCTEMEFKLAHLLLEGIIFCNNGWWLEKQGKPWQSDYVTLHVICNDVFAWGCADAEDVTYKEIPDLYEMWRKDPQSGHEAWCIKKRKMMPQKPVEKMFRDDGIWNLEELIKG